MSREQASAGALQKRLREAYLDTIPLIEINVTWILLSVLLITALPATGGLYYATNLLAHEKATGWRQVLIGFRRYFWVSWRWGGVNLLVVAILAANILFYRQLGDAGGVPWLVLAGLVLLVGWLGLQTYAFPLLLEQEETRVRSAWRNCAVIFVRRPVASVGLTLSIFVIAVVSTLWLQPAWLFISGSLCAYLANRGTVLAIETLTE